LPIKGLGGTIASATTLLEPRKVFDTNSTSGQLHVDPPLQKLTSSYPRKTSAHSLGSGNSGDNKRKGTKSKSKLVPLTLATKNNHVKGESPKKKPVNMPAFIRKEPPISLNF